jgi:hypothetical protein
MKEAQPASETSSTSSILQKMNDVHNIILKDRLHQEYTNGKFANTEDKINAMKLVTTTRSEKQRISETAPEVNDVLGRPRSR